MSHDPNIFPDAAAAEFQAAQEHAYATLNDLQDANQPLDGPTLTRAGLGYEERIKLGYLGSIDAMVEDASAWKAEKSAAQEPKPVPLPSPSQQRKLENIDEPDTTGRSTEQKQADTKREQAARVAEMQQLRGYRDKYVGLLAGRGRRALTLRSYSARSVALARNQYEQYRDAIIQNELLTLAKAGVSQELIDQATTVQAFQEQRDLARALREQRLEATGNYRVVTKTNEANAQWNEVEAVQKNRLARTMDKFYDWFGSVNNGGKWYSKGAMKKAAVVGGAGLVTGALLGTVLAPAAGTVAAGAVGVGIANRVTKAYMSAHWHRKAADAQALTHADARQGELFQKLGNGTSGVKMTELVEGQTDKEVFRNRRRMAIMGGIALAAGGLGELAAHSLIGGGGGVAHHPGTGSDHGQEQGGGPRGSQGGGHGTGHHHHPHPHEPGKVAGFTSQVQVERGHGYTQELQDLFRQKGVKLSGQQSMNLYNHLVEKFPRGHFFTNDASYVRPQGDFGISRAGGAHWNPQVLEEINRYAKQHRLSRG